MNLKLQINYRPPIERMAYIARLLQGGAKFNATQVANHFEVNRRTISHDIEFMKDRLGYEISYDYSLQTFVGQMPEERVL